MLEQELAMVQQAPKHILAGGATIRCSRQALNESGLLGGLRQSTHRGQEELLDQRCIRQAGLKETRQPSFAGTELSLDGVAADQFQSLTQRGILAALAGTGQRAGRPAKGRKERMDELAVGELRSCACPAESR